MAETITVYQGHTPKFTFVVTQADGTTLDLTGATVSYIAEPYTGVPTGSGFTLTCTVTDATNGIAEVRLTTSNTAYVGTYSVVIRVTYTATGITYTVDSFYLEIQESVTVDGSDVAIGDDPDIEYTQEEIRGINILLSQLRCRLRDSKDIMKETQDEYGNIVLENCPIWSDDTLACFLRNSLSEFNQTPHWTSFLFSDQVIWDRNAHVIVEGAYILALSAGMLAEAGREFTISDNGITMQPPPLSTVMNNQFSALLSAHAERLKFIKCSMKPGPLGVGTFRVLAVSPAYMRLRHLRQRQIV